MSDPLTINPVSMRVLATGSAACFTLTNNGSERLAFKIKCSNGTLYTFKRIVGFLEVAHKEIHMIRAYGPPGDAKVVVQYLPAPVGSPPPLQLFKAGGKPLTATLPVTAVANDIQAPSPNEVANQTSYVGTMCPDAMKQ
ncbi:hypothetical protein L596_013102 [Steinernema carpocapsae]|uniref:MSP domain-containing protein n=1 Tax=Steinernema carpocapsae TaxID=34508 RepID=A0A4U5P016_STECR|nr:hypothetical protein L596_013102 [Steinernema carpocapsae]